MKKSILIVAVIVYSLSLAITWVLATERAHKRSLVILAAAEESFSSVINGEIEAALRNVGGAIINLLDGQCREIPVERMKVLAETFNLDEVNFVNNKGIAISSNVKDVIGFDFSTNELTREFLKLTNSTTTMVSQTFRPGVANPDMMCMYYGLSFPRHSGILQLGVTVERLRQNMYTFTEEESVQVLKDWHFSVVGWYERADMDKNFSHGKIFERWSDENNEMITGRYFDYKGYHYAALLPQSFCYAQRNGEFKTFSIVITVLMAAFTFIFIRLVNASIKLQAMHAQATARTAADLALAKTIQTSSLPAVDGAFINQLEFSFRAVNLPAREVGGDFYDFYQLPNGRVAFLVADVSGKGIPGAMFMMETKNIIKNCLVEFTDLAEAVTTANARICDSNRAELFVTAFIGILNLQNGEMEYVNAGHNRPFIRRTDGTIEKVMGKGGLFLGMFEDATFRANFITLNRDDSIFLYTDGITEAMNSSGELFGEQRLCSALTKTEDDIMTTLSTFVGNAEQSDDITYLMLRWNGAPQHSFAEFPCDESSLAQVVAFIRTALMPCTPKTLAAILNAADELTSNIVNYSGAEKFSITVEHGYDRLRLRFVDAGRPYNPLTHTDPDTRAPISQRPVGGLGLVMVKRLCDRVIYSRTDDCNELTIIKFSEGRA